MAIFKEEKQKRLKTQEVSGAEKIRLPLIEVCFIQGVELENRKAFQLCVT